MFGFPGKFLKMREEASKIREDTEVTEEEFVSAMVANGETPDKAKRQATFSKALGSSVMVGDKMLKIKVQHDHG